jgi:uncharacterized membrane protein YtjA (UPF0391 family)
MQPPRLAGHSEVIGASVRETAQAVPDTSHRWPMPGSCWRWQTTDRRSSTMLNYAIVFFVIAIIAAVLGFGGIAAGAAGIAKILFVVFLVLAVLSLLGGMLRK